MERLYPGTAFAPAVRRSPKVGQIWNEVFWVLPYLFSFFLYVLSACARVISTLFHRNSSRRNSHHCYPTENRNFPALLKIFGGVQSLCSPIPSVCGRGCLMMEESKYQPDKDRLWPERWITLWFETNSRISGWQQWVLTDHACAGSTTFQVPWMDATFLCFLYSLVFL